jgi:hypothetical protein
MGENWHRLEENFISQNFHEAEEIVLESLFHKLRGWFGWPRTKDAG